MFKQKTMFTEAFFLRLNISCEKGGAEVVWGEETLTLPTVQDNVKTGGLNKGEKESSLEDENGEPFTSAVGQPCHQSDSI